MLTSIFFVPQVRGAPCFFHLGFGCELDSIAFLLLVIVHSFSKCVGLVSDELNFFVKQFLKFGDYLIKRGFVIFPLLLVFRFGKLLSLQKICLVFIDVDGDVFMLLLHRI